MIFSIVPICRPTLWILVADPICRQIDSFRFTCSSFEWLLDLTVDADRIVRSFSTKVLSCD